MYISHIGTHKLIIIYLFLPKPLNLSTYTLSKGVESSPLLNKHIIP